MVKTEDREEITGTRRGRQEQMMMEERGIWEIPVPRRRKKSEK